MAKGVILYDTWNLYEDRLLSLKFRLEVLNGYCEGKQDCCELMYAVSEVLGNIAEDMDNLEEDFSELPTI